jgi:hypothetical protein
LLKGLVGSKAWVLALKPIAQLSQKVFLPQSEETTTDITLVSLCKYL